VEREASTIGEGVRPAAARPGYRADLLCASRACTGVLFDGGEIPVCRIHAATYAAWGDDAEDNAGRRWRWRPAEQERPRALVHGDVSD
jgi:hypothetical protein